MKQFEVSTIDGREVKFNFPTSIKEISEDYLMKLTDCIKVADNYSLIALCYSEKLSKVILAGRANKKDAKIKVTPIFVKAGNSNIDFIKNAKIKQRVISMASQIALGTHVIVPGHRLTIDTFIAAINNCNDKDIYNREVANEDQRECLFLEFKIVPNADIIGLLDLDAPIEENPYVTICSGLNGGSC